MCNFGIILIFTGWRDVVTVAAVDCANDINYSLCREYEIMKYPSLRFLGAEVKPGDKGKDMEKTAGVESIRHSLVDMLKKEQADGRGASWPNISPYRSVGAFGTCYHFYARRYGSPHSCRQL